MDTVRTIRLPEVIAITGLSRSSIYEKMNTGDFPVAIKLGDRSVGWYESEIIAWLKSRPRTK